MTMTTDHDRPTHNPRAVQFRAMGYPPFRSRAIRAHIHLDHRYDDVPPIAIDATADGVVA